MKRFPVILFILLSCIGGVASADNISYVIAAREKALLQTQDRIADMVANANTSAFKQEKDSYAERPKRLDNGKKLSFSTTSTTTRDTSQGGINATGRQLDIAINGPGYFMVETPRGTRYTRAGNLKISTEGALITKEGYPLIGPGGGRVELADTDIDITIRDTGLVTSGAEERGQIGVFLFDNEQLLVKEGEGLYRTDQSPNPTEESKIVQGALETSNVNSVTAMTDLIEVSRKIELAKQLQANEHDLQINMIRSLARQ
jgi:flagellar basal-body rod protein FlgF